MNQNRLYILAIAGMCALQACTGNTPNVTEEIKKVDPSSVGDTMKMKKIMGAAGILNVSDGGSGGIPVVFIHSYAGSLDHWKSQIQGLRASRRAVAFDLRGHGESAPPVEDAYSIESMADDIETISDSLRLKRFILVGHSMGGSVAIAYAAKHPKKVAGLFLAGTPGKADPQLQKKIISSLESDDYDSVMQNYMKALLVNSKQETQQMEMEGVGKLSRKATISLIKAIFQFDPLPALRVYKGPTMIVYAQNEDQPGALHNQLTKIPVRMISGTSHWIQLDDPHAFNTILDEFLQQVK